MGWPCFKWLLPLFCAIIVVQINDCNGCFQKEKIALLDYKEFLKFHSYYALPLLPSWVSDPNSDCCTWKNVACDSLTGHVIHLSLSLYDLGWTLPQSFSLNLSLFQPIKELRSLNLSSNCFDGLILAKDYTSMSTLKMLQTLDLSFNLFDMSIIKALKTLTSLKNLKLQGNRMEGEFPTQDLSLLQNLEMLDLSHNRLWSPSTTKDYTSMSTLKMLQTLDLSINFFDMSIIRALKTLTSLKNLILNDNRIKGEFPTQDLSVLQNLEMLDLSRNRLRSPSTTKDLSALSRLRKLKTLNLGSNDFDEKIMEYLFGLPTLTSLSLTDNDITRALDSQGLCNMKTLQELDLNFNNFNGMIDTCLNNLTSLRTLDLSHNNLSGSISSPLFASLTSLEYLSLSNNNFEGVLSGSISSPLFASLTSLEYLSLSNNNFEGVFSLSSMANHSNLKVLALGQMESNKLQVETENPPNWIPSFQLKALQMPNCQVNLSTRAMPSFLSQQHELEFIDLSRNNLVGMFPNWLLVNNPKLEYLFLNDNSFTGSFQLPPGLNKLPDQMVEFDISQNKIQGRLPKNIGLFFPRLESLNVSSNILDGDIPASIGEMSNLRWLDLAHNNFSGIIPKRILLGCISLRVLSLSNNSLQGQVFHTSPNLIGLEYLMMDNNQFNGTLEDGLLSVDQLHLLDVSNNKLSGRLLAGWIGKERLHYLSVSRNEFEGEIPKELCKLDLISINLSHNRFSGAIPSCFNMSSLAFIHLQGNSFTGTIPGALSSSLRLEIIDLRDNRLFGSIPKGIYGLKNLMFLLLGSNKLQGELPSQICKLKGLTFLDLSHNNFTGPIPSCFSNISFAKDIHFSTDSNFLFETGDGIMISEYSYGGYHFQLAHEPTFSFPFEEEVQLIVKSLALSYKGDILNYMSGLDLSFNQLTGEIPSQLGELPALYALNLSHNHLNGTIPESFHKLELIESLDLSYNNLSGNIPIQLQDLNSLAIFNVSYNNLSGVAPDQGQFGTFDESSYKGNPCLHLKNSNRGIATFPTSPTHSNDTEKNESAIDFIAFSWTFAASFVMVQLILVAVLWINPHWRRAWFYFIETCLYKCCGQFLPYAFY